MMTRQRGGWFNNLGSNNGMISRIGVLACAAASQLCLLCICDRDEQLNDSRGCLGLLCQQVFLYDLMTSTQEVMFYDQEISLH